MKLLALAVLALPLVAQRGSNSALPDTNPFLDQLAVRPGAIDGVIGILGGQLVTLKWGSGIVLDGSSVTVQFPQPVQPPPQLTAVVGEFYRFTAPTTTQLLAFTPLSAAVCYRNGLRLTQGVDYTVSGNLVTFLPDENGGAGNAPVAGDLFTFDYQH